MLNTAALICKIVGRMVLLPEISWIAARVYRLVADNRSRLPARVPGYR